MGLKNETVILENDFETWKKMFEKEKKKLIKIFKENKFQIKHVGSTSIKGLSAKPIVDIMDGIEKFDDIKKYINKLSKLYIVKENYNNDEILLIKENKNETFYLIHILLIDSPRYKNMLSFRNILKKNPDILKKYENLKKELAQKYPNNRKLYTKSKNKFISMVLKSTNNN